MKTSCIVVAFVLFTGCQQAARNNSEEKRVLPDTIVSISPADSTVDDVDYSKYDRPD